MNFNEYLEQFKKEVEATVLTEEQREGAQFRSMQDEDQIVGVVGSEETKKIHALAEKYHETATRNALSLVLLGKLPENENLENAAAALFKESLYREAFFRLVRDEVGSPVEDIAIREGFAVVKVPPMPEGPLDIALLQAMRRPN